MYRKIAYTLMAREKNVQKDSVHFTSMKIVFSVLFTSIGGINRRTQSARKRELLLREREAI